MLAVLYWCSMNAKRGPKPSGVKKIVYYRRVSPELVAKLDEAILRITESRFNVDGWLKVSYGVSAAPGVVAEVKPLEVVSKPDPQIGALLDNVESLTLQVKALEYALGEALEADLDEKAAYWRIRALKAEQANSKAEFDQT